MTCGFVVGAYVFAVLEIPLRFLHFFLSVYNLPCLHLFIFLAVG